MRLLREPLKKLAEHLNDYEQIEVVHTCIEKGSES